MPNQLVSLVHSLPGNLAQDLLVNLLGSRVHSPVDDPLFSLPELLRRNRVSSLALNQVAFPLSSPRVSPRQNPLYFPVDNQLAFPPCSLVFFLHHSRVYSPPVNLLGSLQVILHDNQQSNQVISLVYTPAISLLGGHQCSPLFSPPLNLRSNL